MYRWDVCRLEGACYDPAYQAQQEWLDLLLADCPTQDADKPHLKDKGERMYWYAKTIRIDRTVAAISNLGD